MYTHTKGRALLTELVFRNELAFITWLAWAGLVLSDDAVSILIVLLEVGDFEGGILEKTLVDFSPARAESVLGLQSVAQDGTASVGVWW